MESFYQNDSYEFFFSPFSQLIQYCQRTKKRILPECAFAQPCYGEYEPYSNNILCFSFCSYRAARDVQTHWWEILLRQQHLPGVGLTAMSVSFISRHSRWTKPSCVLKEHIPSATKIALHFRRYQCVEMILKSQKLEVASERYVLTLYISTKKKKRKKTFIFSKRNIYILGSVYKFHF